MTTFTTDQSLPIPELTDIANGPNAFAALAAAFEPRLFRVYASAVDRSMRNPTPAPGSVSVLLDTGRVEVYRSGAWVDLWQALNPLYAETFVTAPATTGVTETFAGSVTFTAVASRRYQVRYTGSWQTNTVGDVIGIRLRWKAGGTVDSAGTLMRQQQFGAADSANQSVPFTTEATSGVMTPGQVTVGVSCYLASGLNTVTIDGAAGNQGLLCVQDIGPA